MPSSLPPCADVRCRNCGADAPGDYCPACGQETRVTLPKVGEMVREAAGRLVAWDGRLWRTLATLAFRPGVLTREYYAGRRRRYVRPARLFLALSLLLFALLSVVRSPSFIGDEVRTGNESEIAALPAERTGVAPAGEGEVAAKARGSEGPGVDAKADEALLNLQAGGANAIGFDREMNLRIRFGGIERQLPAEIQKRYRRFKALSTEDRIDHIYAGMMRYGPYMAVLMLPVLALLLKLVYLGSGRRYPGRPQHYAEHLVYSAHMHSFAALVVLMWLVPQPDWTQTALLVWAVYYVLRARNVVYGGRLWAGVLRTLLVATVYACIAVLALAGLALAAAVLR